VITLFSYMSGVNKPKLSFVKELRQGVVERFPEFEKNSYYLKETGNEEKELIAMQGKSAVAFFWYYRLKLFVRKLRK